MSTFILVHGTGCGSWVWSKLTPLLRAQGNDVYTPTLSGLADRKHLLNGGIISAVEDGKLGELFPFTGQSAGQIHEILPAAEIVHRLVAEAEEVLKGMSNIIG